MKKDTNPEPKTLITREPKEIRWKLSREDRRFLRSCNIAPESDGVHDPPPISNE